MYLWVDVCHDFYRLYLSFNEACDSKAYRIEYAVKMSSAFSVNLWTALEMMDSLIQ